MTIQLVDQGSSINLNKTSKNGIDNLPMIGSHRHLNKRFENDLTPRLNINLTPRPMNRE